MQQVVIEHLGPPMPRRPPAGEIEVAKPGPYKPYLVARAGDRTLVQASVELYWEAEVNAAASLARLGVTEGRARYFLYPALLKFGLRRMKLLVAELMESDSQEALLRQEWGVFGNDADELLALIYQKSCDYQISQGRDLFCSAYSDSGAALMASPSARRLEPTSRPLCRGCLLPGAEVLCAHLSHPRVTEGERDGGIRRVVRKAFCDRAMDGINEPEHCHAGGHSCWQQIVEAEERRPAPTSPLTLPESFDVLDAMWRLAFGRKVRLVTTGTTVGVAALALDCANRTEFESRLSAIADMIDLLKVDDNLLPPTLTDEQKIGSINRLSGCLTWKLPTAQHGQVKKAIQTLRLVRQARNAMQHGKVDGGLTPKLQALGIRDAPPNWPEAWNTIRGHVADALTIIRTELRRWIDAQDNEPSKA